MENILTAETLETYTLDSDLANETDAQKAKYIERAESIVTNYIDLEQFDEEEDYPDDVKLATVYIVEYLYTQGGKMQAGGITSERIGDYSYTRQDNNLTVDIPKNARLILDQYRPLSGKFNLTIGGHDRKYV